jgi:hypothetical protein
MKTAMQELIDDLDRTLVKSIFERLEKEGLFNKALEKEKEQIKNAYRFPNTLVDMSSEQYYHETFNTKEK